MEKQLNELKTRLMEIYDLGHIGALLGWDEATYMPPGGAAARGHRRAGRIHARRRLLPVVARCRLPGPVAAGPGGRPAGQRLPLPALQQGYPRLSG